METPFFLPQPNVTIRIKNSSGSVSERRTLHTENLETDSKPKPEVYSKRNRLKRVKTYKRSNNVTDNGNNPTYATEILESGAACDDVTLRKEKQSADAVINTDGKDNSGLPLSTSCLRMNTSDKERLMGQLEVNTGQIPESTKHHETAQAWTLPPQRICRESTNVENLGEMRLSWRSEFTSEICREILEEIQILNSQFPVHRFFTLLLRKRTEPEEESFALEAEKNDNYKHHSVSCVQRKRKQEEKQTCDRKSKRHRTNKDISADKLVFAQFSDVLDHSHAKYRNRLSRTKRRQQQITLCSVVTELMQNDSVHQDPWPSHLQKDDILWTDKYRPQQFGEVIGNSASVGQLHSWLKEWKIRADTEARKIQEERRMKKENINESWDCGDFEGDTVVLDHEKKLCNTVLMIGPSGVGKTAAVYACAEELGFKVFEVNSSVLRCGRLILSQLTEATQSHQMDIQRIQTLKPEFIKQSKMNPAAPYEEAHRKVTSSSQETSSTPSASHIIQKPQPIKLTHFFKLNSKKYVGKTPEGSERCIHAVELKPDRLQRSGSGFKHKRQGVQESTCSSKDPLSGRQSRTIPMSLILFEEVDVIFPADFGFLSAIKTFMSTTKRPIILTTNDPLFGGRLKGDFDEIYFKTPSLQTTRSYLQCLCVVENMRTDPEDIAFLLCQNKGDIRQSILQLQLWVCSGGGSTELQILKNALKCGSWAELENSRCLEILGEKTGGGLLYSNIESLFSPHFYQQKSVNPQTRAEKPVEGLMLQTSTNVHEVKSNRLSACRRKKHSSLCEPKTISYPPSLPKHFSLDKSCKASIPSKQTKDLTSETNVCGQSESFRLVFQHVLCIAKFFDNMSFLDAYLQKPSLSGTGLWQTEPPGWMGATLKDGLLDLPREEQYGQCFENNSQILALVECLGFHRCRTELSGIWMEAASLREKLSSERWEQMICVLSVPSDKKTLRMCHCKFCEPSSVQKHKEIVSILFSSTKICCHSNKRALSMDYLPTLRSICKSERVKGQHSLRCSHYLSSLHLPRSLLEHMALDFP